MEEAKKGLENIIALETSISSIDGVKGVLKYRGILVNDLLDMPYDAVSYLLIRGKLPDKNELAAYSALLKERRPAGENVLNVLRTCNFNIEAMDALRTAISYMSHCDPDLSDNSEEANLRKAANLVAKFPTIIAAFSRIAIGKEPVPPNPALSHGANFLYMLRGSKPTELEAEIMEKDFILSAEHELNASSFASRITASTLSDLYSAIITGICTLKGPLHGGARMAVMDMIDEIAVPEDSEAYVLEKMANNEKIMGFGHRVYLTQDPRTGIFKKLAKELAESRGNMKWYETGENIENAIFKVFTEKTHKPIYPNVDFYSGIVYKYLDIPPRLATAVFAIGRISGWIAHCMEQYSDNRVIRPRAKYVKAGQPPENEPLLSPKKKIVV
ncbi:citrate/2-methylcitrate synthase [Methanosarcina sp. KYL-1]|uniref:citrate/2-methylcitrate synthase n=1 Tax=Methanosarcina sp. KYL-1 TaxID=2602068 RepID=UPI002100DE50|nr:citrate/2-methylcitrate synthase [Methanosarcina sp. KYL-1]